VRFEVGTHALAPDLEVLAPARNWGMTRADSVDYAEKWDIPIRASKEKIYSIDENLWGRAIECGAMEDPWAAPPDEPYTLTKITNEQPVELVLSFKAGLPVAIDSEPLGLADLIKRLNDRCGATGFGRIDMVENRRVGIKSREVYECPAALAIITAHSDLEDLVLERDLHHEKARLETRWAELIYDGMWFSPLKEALDSFMFDTQRHVSGDVRLSLAAPGLLRVTGRRSPHALYDHGLATYDAADTFRHSDSEGYVKIYGLGVKTWAARQGAKNATPPRP
jgi:argininosuccinate synthase